MTKGNKIKKKMMFLNKSLEFYKNRILNNKKKFKYYAMKISN